MVHGEVQLSGTWRARKAMGGWGIEDEMQLVDASGNPAALIATTRFYDVRAKHWTASGFDIYRGRHTLSTAIASASGMRSESRRVDADGAATRSRGIIERVDRDHIVFRQDHSYDDGLSWDEDMLVIEGTRMVDASGS